MTTLTDKGLDFVRDFARRRGMTKDSAMMILEAVHRGGGTMAQFRIPEWGACQWMHGGMTMAGDMGNHELKAAVNEACSEMANRIGAGDVFEAGSKSESGWWPTEWGEPSATGSQNAMRYAVFSQLRRLAVQSEGKVALYDTGSHQLHGVSQQQQGSTGTLSFQASSGPVNLSDFRDLADNGSVPTTETGKADDIPHLIARLAELRTAGVLTNEEFEKKKAELLGRI